MPRAELARLYPLLVADFQREYRLDLLGADCRLGSRRFLMLVSGLSAGSLLWQRIDSHERAQEALPLEGDAAEQAVLEFFGR